MKTEAIDDVAMGLGAAGRQCERAPVPFERLVYLSLFAVLATQVVADPDAERD